MGFDKTKFALLFSLPLDARDWDNLEASGVKLVMLPLGTAMAMLRAQENGLARLASMGVSVVIRVEEDAYYSDESPVRILNQVRAISRFVLVVAVIVGVEPDIAYRLDWGSEDWGQEHAWEHRQRFDAVRVPLRAAGYYVCSPGWGLQVLLPNGTRGRSISEDDPPVPGAIAWREITSQPDLRYTPEQGQFGYLSANGAAWHEYQYGWQGFVDELRLRFSLRRAQEWHHREIWICELGISDSSSQVDKMRAYIDQAQMLMRHRLGRRVRMLCFFIANGNPGWPPAWDPRYLITEPAAYRLLGDWMRG